MATFSLVHGAWGRGLQWDLVRAELEARGHVVHTPDMPCEDLDAGVDEYVAAVPPCDIVVGHSLGGMTIPYVEARLHVFLCALVAGAVTSWDDVFVEGFGAGTVTLLGRRLPEQAWHKIERQVGANADSRPEQQWLEPAAIRASQRAGGQYEHRAQDIQAYPHVGHGVEQILVLAPA